VQLDSRDHLGMAILQATVEVAVGAKVMLLEVLVDGFFLVFVRHVCSEIESGSTGVEGGWGGGSVKIGLEEKRRLCN